MIPAHRPRLSRDTRRRLWLTGRLRQAPHGGAWLLAMAAAGTISAEPRLVRQQAGRDLRPQPPLRRKPGSRNPSPASVSKSRVKTSYRTRLAGPGPACRCDPSRHDVLMVIAGMARMMPLGPLAGHGCGGSREAVQFHG